MRFRTIREAGGLLREQRVRRGLTQMQLASMLDTTQDRISKLERGHHRLEVGFVLRAFEVLELELFAQQAEQRADEDPFLGVYGGGG